MPTTPAWKTGVAGIPGNRNAFQHASRVQQNLGTHAFQCIYSGAPIVNPTCGTQATYFTPGDTLDFDQPFVMPAGKTSIGRIEVPIWGSGEMADVLVSLFPDDGSGHPNITNGPLVSTYVPADYISNVIAPVGLPSGGPLALAQFNTMYGTGGINALPYAGPTGDASGLANFSSTCTYGNFQILAGGFTANPVPNVNIIPFQGGTTIGAAVAQPPLPAPSYLGAVAATNDFLVFSGGNNASAVTNAVWVAGWDSVAGLVSSWSAQTVLPVNLFHHASVAHDASETVYIIGGVESVSNAAQSTVYYTTMNNGQITSWITGPALPVTLFEPLVSVIGNWLIVAGGSQSFSSIVGSSNVYYAAIDPVTGVISSWETGPSLPVGVYGWAPGWDVGYTDSAMITLCGFTNPTTTTTALQIITVTPEGLGERWIESGWRVNGPQSASMFPLSSGEWVLINTDFNGSQYWYTTLRCAGLLSVPMPVTGLTATSTYHVMMQQNQTVSDSDFLAFPSLDNTGLPDGLRSVRHSGTWSVEQGGRAWPIIVMDPTTTPGDNRVWHTWSDNGNQTSSVNLPTQFTTQMYNDPGMLWGVVESTTLPNDTLNTNPTLSTGIAPWTGHFGTFTLSNAQTQGGFANSGLLTPTGGNIQAYAQSEMFPIQALGNSFYLDRQWYKVTGFFYSATTITSGNFSLSVNWYDWQGNYISTSSFQVSESAGAWFGLTNYYQAPFGAAQASIDPTRGGSPGPSDLLYCSNLIMTLSPEYGGTLTSVAQVVYGTPPWPPTGVVQLA